VQSAVRDAWTSAGVRTRQKIQQDVQGHAISRDTTEWSSVAPSHSVGRIGLTGSAKCYDWSLAVYVGLRKLTAWAIGGAEGNVNRSTRRQRRPGQAGRGLHDRLRGRLKKAADWADCMFGTVKRCIRTTTIYVRRDKRFDEGDKVIVR